MKYLTILTTFTFVAVCLAQQQPCYNQYDPRPLVLLFHHLVLYTHNYLVPTLTMGLGITVTARTVCPPNRSSTNTETCLHAVASGLTDRESHRHMLV